MVLLVIHRLIAAGTSVAQTRGAKSGDADFPFASIFVEYAKTMNKDLDIIIGLDYVPFKAEIDSKSFADTSLQQVMLWSYNCYWNKKS